MTLAVTGLRWGPRGVGGTTCFLLHRDHSGCSTESAQEGAALIQEAARVAEAQKSQCEVTVWVVRLCALEGGTTWIQSEWWEGQGELMLLA